MRKNKKEGKCIVKEEENGRDVEKNQNVTIDNRI